MKSTLPKLTPALEDPHLQIIKILSRTNKGILTMYRAIGLELGQRAIRATNKETQDLAIAEVFKFDWEVHKKALPLKKFHSPQILNEIKAFLLAKAHEYRIDIEEIEERPLFTKFPKQYLDSKLREPMTMQTLVKYSDRIANVSDEVFKSTGIRKEEIEIAIQGGLTGIDWTFEQGQIIHGIFYLFQKNKYSLYFRVGRYGLYDAMNMGNYIDKDGKRKFYEGPGNIERRKLDIHLADISKKVVPFIFSAVTGRDKKGKDLRTLAIDYAPIVKIIPVYKEVTQVEFEDLKDNPKNPKKSINQKLAYYEIHFNPNIVGKVGYFRALPFGVAQEIKDYRRTRGGRSSSYELSFIEYLCEQGITPIEINYLKLANKLHVNKLSDKRHVRKVVNRCYETAIALQYVLRIERDAPSLFNKRDKKDIIHLNPERFYKLRFVQKQPENQTQDYSKPKLKGANAKWKRCER